MLAPLKVGAISRMLMPAIHVVVIVGLKVSAILIAKVKVLAIVAAVIVMVVIGRLGERNSNSCAQKSGYS